MLTRSQEGPRLFARGLEIACGLLRKRMDATMNIGVLAGIVRRDCVDDGLGFLRGRGVVEIRQAFPVHLALEDRKLFANALPLHAHRPSSQRSNNPATGQPSSTSPA